MATLPTERSKSRELACIKYNMSERIPVVHTSALDSSKDGTLFAAGLYKRVYVYNYRDVLRYSPSKLVSPSIDVKCANYVRSLCFSKQYEQYMIFGDSQGQLHCINDTRMFSLSQAQHKGAVRSLCYSVHGEFVFSGAEDKTVKIWCPSSLRNIYTVQTINCPVTVCAHPSEPHILSYATPDSISGVDLRNPKVNLFELSGCDKPITYMEFINTSELITRTNDSVQLWDIASKQRVRSYVSPSQERHTGTSVLNGMIACGSESNSVLIYDKDWSLPRVCHMFKNTPPQSDDALNDSVRNFLRTLPWWNPNKAAPPEYINSVCWKDNNHIIAACTAGYLYILKIDFEN